MTTHRIRVEMGENVSGRSRIGSRQQLVCPSPLAPVRPPLGAFLTTVVLFKACDTARSCPEEARQTQKISIKAGGTM